MPREEDSSATPLLEALGPGLWRAGSCDQQSIEQLEDATGFSLPPSYKQFLLRFGAVAIGDCVISDVIGNDPLSPEGGSFFGDSERARAEHQLPSRYFVLQPDEDAPYCFDVLAREHDGEFAVVCYELHGGNAQKVASSFSEWVREFFVPNAR